MSAPEPVTSPELTRTLIVCAVVEAGAWLAAWLTGWNVVAVGGALLVSMAVAGVIFVSQLKRQK